MSGSIFNSLLGGESSERRERRGAVVVGEQGYFDHALALIQAKKFDCCFVYCKRSPFIRQSGGLAGRPPMAVPVWLYSNVQYCTVRSTLAPYMY